MLKWQLLTITLLVPLLWIVSGYGGCHLLGTAALLRGRYAVSKHWLVFVCVFLRNRDIPPGPCAARCRATAPAHWSHGYKCYRNVPLSRENVSEKCGRTSSRCFSRAGVITTPLKVVWAPSDRYLKSKLETWNSTDWLFGTLKMFIHTSCRRAATSSAVLTLFVWCKAGTVLSGVCHCFP